jgi:CDP-diacylglycerol--serine O-phosphatidyltransferase
LPGPGEVAVTPVVGLGSGNPLNETILALLRSTKRKVVLYTPYFNLPRALRSEISHLLSSGREVTIVVGDKTANDFFIPIDEPLKTSGLLPYLYEGNLRRFARTHRRSIADGRLNIHLWSHEGNSFHLKGVLVDDRFALLTGSNLNPRSWKLDLENGLVIRDPHGLLVRSHEEELGAILKYARRLTGNHDLETPAAYPKRVERAMKLLGRARLDRLLNRLL